MYKSIALALAVFGAASVFAQSPTPEPTATPSPTPEASPAAAAPEASPSPADAQATPAAAPTETSDVIPLPPQGGPTDKPIVSESEIAPMPKPSGGENPDAAFTDPNAVIPDANSVETPPGPPPSAAPSAGEIERRLKVRYKQVRIEADKDPAIAAMLKKAESAKTMEDERAAYREYYRMLFKKMRKIDSSLTAKCDTMERAYLSRLAQYRLEPTIPLNPPPQPESLSN